MEMSLDVVHDIQKVYRKVLNAMSRPGNIENVRDVEDKFELSINCYKSTYLLMLMILDGEVSYSVKDNDELAIDVHRFTGAKNISDDKADYIFVLNNYKNIDKVIKKAKIGTLIDPQKSATFIVEVELIKNEENLLLSGPGIKAKTFLDVSINNDWIKVRNEKNKEYPLGIDMIFVDKQGNLACIPRTTKIEEV